MLYRLPVICQNISPDVQDLSPGCLLCHVPSHEDPFRPFFRINILTRTFIRYQSPSHKSQEEALSRYKKNHPIYFSYLVELNRVTVPNNKLKKTPYYE